MNWAPKRWRAHLGERVALILTMSGVALTVAIYLGLAGVVRQDTYDSRVHTLLGDAAVRVASAQSRLDGAAFTSAEQVQSAANETVVGLYESARGVGATGVMLRRAPAENSAVTINDLQTSSQIPGLVTAELRGAVHDLDYAQHWQAVALREPGRQVPGIVVASRLVLPLAGVHELYIVYTLAPEEQLVDQLLSFLLVASVAVVISLGVITYLVVRRQLRPVAQISDAAARLAEGNLSERVQVRGEDEVAVLGQSFNNMADSLQDQIDRLGELSRLQQRFVSDVSHELRTPLATITAAAQMLHDSKEEFDPLHRRPIELLAEQTTRFDEMLADLLEISRFDAGAAVLTLEDRDIREVVHRTVELVRPIATDRGSDIVVHEPQERCGVAIDPRRIERVLRNLLFNAVEHGEGRRIDVTVAKSATAVAVRVRDHGVGMRREVAEHVFDRFYRADPSRARTLGGTGLGLAISLEDARLHGGTLEAWGRTDEGASFLLTLPQGPDTPIGEPPLQVEPPDREFVTPPLGTALNPMLLQEITQAADVPPPPETGWQRWRRRWRELWSTGEEQS